LLSGAPVWWEWEPMTGAKRLTGRDWLELLLTLAQAPKGATQRSVAQRLGITKVEARRRLRSAVTAGLVVESVHHTSAEPGRRVFSLRHPEGTEALELLQRKALRRQSPQ
jgi:DNA-binding IclR family transcriptional regulator